VKGATWLSGGTGRATIALRPALYRRDSPRYNRGRISHRSHTRKRRLPYTATVNTRAPAHRPIDRRAMQVHRCANGADQSRRVSRGVANEARCGRGVARRIQTSTPLYMQFGRGGGPALTITSVDTRPARATIRQYADR